MLLSTDLLTVSWNNGTYPDRGVSHTGENMRNMIEWAFAVIIMGFVVFFVYLAIAPDTRTINANIGLSEIESGSYYQRVVSIPLHGDIDIKINDKYWIYIDTR